MRGLPTALLAVAIATVTGSTGKANVIYLNQILDRNGQSIRNARRLITAQVHENNTVESGDTGITRGIITALTPGIGRSLSPALGQMLFDIAGLAFALRQSRRVSFV